MLAAGSGFAVTGVLTAVSGLLLAGRLHMHSHSVAGGVVLTTSVSLAELPVSVVPIKRLLVVFE